VLSLVTCVSGAADAPASGCFVGRTAAGNAVTAAANEAACAVTAGMAFAALGVEGGRVEGAGGEAGLVATDSRRAPALDGCWRSLTITGSLAWVVAGTCVATGVTPWRR
jgi:hypothetical protein